MNQHALASVAAALQAARAAGSLPADAEEQAQLLHSRLMTPVRVTIAGPRQIGKSTLLNLLVGSDIIPQGVQLQALSVKGGPKDMARCRYADGSERTFGHADLASLMGDAPVYVQIVRDLPALKKISLLEIQTGPQEPGDAERNRRALDWAAKRTDIMLWCDLSFTENNQAVWDLLPEVVRDHSFLVITKASLFAGSPASGDVVQHLRESLLGSFRDVLQVDAKDAIAARAIGDDTAFAASGAKLLIGALLDEIESAKIDAMDRAQILLMQAKHLDETVSEPSPNGTAPSLSAEPAPKASLPAVELSGNIDPVPEYEDDIREPLVFEAVPSSLTMSADAGNPTSKARRIADFRSKLAATAVRVADTRTDADPAGTSRTFPAVLASTEPAPLAPVTRALFRTIIGRLSDVPAETEGTASESDLACPVLERATWIVDVLERSKLGNDDALIAARGEARVLVGRLKEHGEGGSNLDRAAAVQLLAEFRANLQLRMPA